MLIDLQIHSTYSDGFLTPSQLADFLSINLVKIAALADHNTVAGLDEFKRACRKKGIRAINGLELYVSWERKKFNLLWYNFDPGDPELHELLRDSQARRRRLVRQALLKLKKNKFEIDADKLLDKFSHYIPLNRLADLICRLPGNKKLIIKKLGTKTPGPDEIINALFKNPSFSKIGENRVAFKRILKLRRRLGGQLILNHPGKHSRLDVKFIAKLKKAGLDGLEVISPHHTINTVMYTQRLTNQYKLIMTGGSDFHLSESGTASLKNCYNYFRIDSKYLNGINKIIG